MSVFGHRKIGVRYKELSALKKADEHLEDNKVTILVAQQIKSFVKFVAASTAM